MLFLTGKEVLAVYKLSKNNATGDEGVLIEVYKDKNGNAIACVKDDHGDWTYKLPKVYIFSIFAYNKICLQI